MADDIEKFIEEEGKKTRDHFNERTEETKRYFDVVAERLEGEIKQVAEGVATNTRQLERLADVPDKLEKIDGHLDVIETTLVAVNLPVLKQKITALEKRVEILEAKG